jgi:hypothetical protein
MRSRRTFRGGVVWGAWCVVVVGLWGCSGDDSGAAAPGDAGSETGGEPADDANGGTSAEAAPASDGATSGSSGQVVLYTSALRDFTSSAPPSPTPLTPNPIPPARPLSMGCAA